MKIRISAYFERHWRKESDAWHAEKALREKEPNADWRKVKRAGNRARKKFKSPRLRDASQVRAK